MYISHQENPVAFQVTLLYQPFFTEYLLYFQRALAAAAAPDTPREFAAIVADNLNESHLQEAENLGITLAEKMLSSGKGSDCLEKPKNLGVEGLILSFNT